jgi:para-aminobenzoate synthetase component 1
MSGLPPARRAPDSTVPGPAPGGEVVDPITALGRWPADRAVAALVSGPGGGRWSRRSILAEPSEIRTVRVPAGLAPGEARRAVEGELRRAFARRSSPSPDAGWIVSLAYDLGRVVEAKAGALDGGAVDDRDWPLATLCWCPDALRFDHLSRRWSVIGDPARVPLEAVFGGAPIKQDDSRGLTVGPLVPRSSRGEFESAVDRCVRLIRDGDLYQANLARRMSAAVSGDMRRLAGRAFAASAAWFGAYLECGDGRAVISMSPELFLELDAASRRVVTRPIKGTRPIDADPAELAASGKDAAELAMIVDLMRNDLGRLAVIGSVRVESPRQIESHAAVHHGVAEVSATLRADADRVDLLAATFPPGSVTGAPKVRAMQVIDALEPVRRGPYCGAVGLASTDGGLALNVAIRTIAVQGRGHPRRPGLIDGNLDYWAGCGIVADSVPAAEWEESVAKSEVLLRALRPD